MKKNMSRLGASVLAFVVPVYFVTAVRAQIFANKPIDRFWITDGDVKTIADGGDAVYLGGSFTYISPYTGGGVRLGQSTAVVDLDFPRIDGDVNVFASDGNGGWFVGGSFLQVAGVPRRYLAHIRADRKLDPDWAVDVGINGPLTITALAVLGNTLYLAGDFATVAGQARPNLAAVDAGTGALLPWNPAPSGQYQGIRALAGHDGRIYVGGDFTSIGGENHAGLAALDPVSGTPRSWNPSVSGTIVTIVPSGNIVYVGGFFDHVNAEVRQMIAAIDSGTGATLPWDPNASGNFFAMVDSIVPDGDIIYVAGLFTAIGGQNRAGIAALDRVTGQATGWDPGSDGFCISIAVNQGLVYASGAFTTIGGQARRGLAALDPLTGTATAWNPRAGGDVVTLSIDGDHYSQVAVRTVSVASPDKVSRRWTNQPAGPRRGIRIFPRRVTSVPQSWPWQSRTGRSTSAGNRLFPTASPAVIFSA